MRRVSGGSREVSHFFLFVVELLPLCTQEFAHLAKTGGWVFCLDALTPVLGEEHVGGEGTFRRLRVFFALDSTRG